MYDGGHPGAAGFRAHAAGAGARPVTPAAP